VKSRFGEHLWLDITLLGEQHIKRNLREVFDICHHFLGSTRRKEWIPVRPAQHYTMGGVRTTPTGESPTLKGLFAAGEAACWDMHGFNRLGGNSVAETVVAGMIVGEFIADFCDRASDLDIPLRLVREFLEREQAKLDVLLPAAAARGRDRAEDRDAALMTDKVGIFRTGEKPAAGGRRSCRGCWRAAATSACPQGAGANPELVTPTARRRCSSWR
jgi:fumarate reductase flavoprotein subunit